MPIVPLALLGALVYAFINVLKYAQARQWGAVLTQVCTWAGGIAAVFLVSASKIGETIKFTTGTATDRHSYTLTTLDTMSKLVLGLLASSLFATAFNQFIKARDNNDTAATPSLFASLNQTVTDTVAQKIDSSPEPEPNLTTEAIPVEEAEKPKAPTKKAAAKKAASPRKRT
jgi:hypothetical protein